MESPHKSLRRQPNTKPTHTSLNRQPQQTTNNNNEHSPRASNHQPRALALHTAHSNNMVKTHRAHAARAGRPTSPSTSSMAKLWRQSGAFVICKQRKRAMPTDDAATPSSSQAETTASSTDAAAASRRANLRRAGRGMRRATTFFQPVA